METEMKSLNACYLGWKSVIFESVKPKISGPYRHRLDVTSTSQTARRTCTIARQAFEAPSHCTRMHSKPSSLRNDKG